MLAALETFGDLLTNEDVVSFVDNQGALGVLVSGSSSDRPMGRMAHEAASVQRRMRARFFCTSMSTPLRTSPISRPGVRQLKRRASCAIISRCLFGTAQ